MKIMRVFSIVAALAVPVAAFASNTGRVSFACCTGHHCCPGCPFCPSHLHK
jgi:hypothetical protein